MKTLIAVDCDPQCAAKQAVGDLYTRCAVESFDASDAILHSTFAELSAAKGETAARFIGTNTLAAIGEACSRACALMRFANEYDQTPMNFGPEVEVVINAIKED